MGSDISPREWQDESQFIILSNNMARWSEREPVQINMRTAYIKRLNTFLRYPLGCGPGISVGIASGYGLVGPGIESRWGRDFSHTSRPALGPTQPPVQLVQGLSWG
jgi:hypothetical protein